MDRGDDGQGHERPELTTRESWAWACAGAALLGWDVLITWAAVRWFGLVAAAGG